MSLFTFVHSRRCEFILLLVTIILLVPALYSCFMWISFIICLYTLLHTVRRCVKQSIPTSGKGVLITGCDTGFGHELAKRLHSIGFIVFAGVLDNRGKGADALRDINSDRIRVVKMDVTNQNEIQDVVEYVALLKIDLWGVVNNAGFNVIGDVELCLLKHYHKCLDVNLFGMIRVIKAFLPFIRKSKGRIVNVSSVKGRFTLPCDAVYHVSKYAVETLSDSLRLEMLKFGVTVCIVEPGHYGAVTSCSSPKQLARMKNELEEMWNDATEEVRCTYGREYIEHLYQKQTVAMEPSSRTIVPVIDALEDALVNKCPKVRYLVPGSKNIIDKKALFARVYGILPEFITDYLAVVFTKCDTFPITENQKKER